VDETRAGATIRSRRLRKPCQKLPETALRVASPRLTTPPSTAPLTCLVVWARVVLHGVVNHRRIDGKDGVAGSIPAGGSTKPLTSVKAGQRPSLPGLGQTRSSRDVAEGQNLCRSLIGPLSSTLLPSSLASSQWAAGTAVEEHIPVSRHVLSGSHQHRRCGCVERPLRVRSLRRQRRPTGLRSAAPSVPGTVRAQPRGPRQKASTWPPRDLAA
jgi:hypothetical protein